MARKDIGMSLLEPGQGCSAVQEQESFSEYFQALRVEAEDFLTAQKPMSSAHIRKMSVPQSELQHQVTELLTENETLRRMITDLQAENLKLKQQLQIGPWTLSPSASSVAETRGEDLSPGDHKELLLAAAEFEEGVSKPFCALDTQQMNPHQFPVRWFEQCRKELTASETGVNTEEIGAKLHQLKSEVHKHKLFIKKLKDALLKVLAERSREKAAHKDLKAELHRLRELMAS